jgi:hypothetical protein
MVTGVVEAWGRIEVHEAGFRAEHARPTTLFAEAGAPKERRQMIKRLAKSYGADVIEVVDDRELAAQIESLPHGVDPAWLEELLASGVELTLKSAANGFLSGREQIALGGAGYLLKGHDPPDRWRPQQEVPERGVWVARVAGTAFRPHALQDRSFDPGRAVRLIPEPHNPHDPNAIGIWDEGLTLQAGFIPAELASIVGRMLGEGRLAVAMSLWQWRDLESGQRIGLHVLLSCTDRIDSVPGTDLEFLAHMERERGDDPGPESDWSGAALERPDDAIEW